MLVLNAAQVRAWDEFTIREEPVASLDLMERAAEQCMQWLLSNGYAEARFSIYCGKGNNGGDGLALGRLLSNRGLSVKLHILEFGHLGTPDFQTNLARLHDTAAEIRFVSGEEHLQQPDPDELIIDALFGTGLNRPLEGLSAAVVRHINQSGNEIISIDLPSGLYADKSSGGSVLVRATHTLSFECYKPALLLAENYSCTGRVTILSIGLHPRYLEGLRPFATVIGDELARRLIHPRSPYAHKGDFGQAGLLAGSFGMMGAAVLAGRAVLRAGAGKLTCHLPACGYAIMQQSLPEAMCQVEPGEKQVESLSSLPSYQAWGIGPGWGNSPHYAGILEKLFSQAGQRLVLDADALNTLGRNPALLQKIPAGSILTPHPKELERLFGKTANDFERLELVKQKAEALRVCIILKGHHSFIAGPDGQAWFNSTGNPGMATGGSGDVLTGILTGLLAQGYPPAEAACLGVFLHGRAGDLAAGQLSEEALLPSDLLLFMGQVFRSLHQP